MAKDLNMWQGIGRLGRDPEVRYLPNGDAVANFSIACGDDYKDKSGNKVEQAEWVNIVAYRKLAEIIGEYLKKGSQVYVQGKLQTRKWEKDGVTRYSTEIIANQMQMLGSSAGTENSASTQGSSKADGGQPTAQPSPSGNRFDDIDDDTIPF